MTYEPATFPSVDAMQWAIVKDGEIYTSGNGLCIADTEAGAWEIASDGIEHIKARLVEGGAVSRRCFIGIVNL